MSGKNEDKKELKNSQNKIEEKNKNKKFDKQKENTKNEKDSSNTSDNIKDNKKASKKDTDNVDKKKNNKKDDSKKSENKSKEEEIVFKNSKSNKKKIAQESAEKDDKIAKKFEENKKIDKNVKKPKDRKKVLIAVIIAIVLMVFILIFSVCFAMIHATKDTIARGVSIKNIDVSNLTYNEAKEKLEEAFDIAIGININLKYEDFSYVIAPADISLSYELNSALEEAYNVGRSGNIIQNNYELLKTAIMNKNIDAKFTFDDDALNTIIEYVSTNVPNLVKQYSYYIEGSNLIIIPGTDGIEVDIESLKFQIIEKIQSRNLTELLNNAEDDNVDIPYNNVTADEINIDAIYSEVKTDPQDAYYVEATETTEFEIHPDVDGVDFAISIDEAKAIVAEEGKDQYVIPLNITKANVTINDIGIEAFPYEVSKCETTYDASNKGRSENLRIAASKINGTVLMPGEQFSFNEVVGERTISEGYQNAAIYSNGQVVDGLAGGICQISSTLYGAALDANLQIDERYNHSFTTSYSKPGKDATVVYGVKDLKFTNTRSYPIKIEASVSGGVCTFTIYGIKEETEYDVKIIPVTTETTAFTTQTIEDTSLPAGTTVVSQAGANGCKVTTYKEVYLNGVQISREVISNDTYQVMTRIVRVGPQATETSTDSTASTQATTETPQADTSTQTPESSPTQTEETTDPQISADSEAEVTQ